MTAILFPGQGSQRVGMGKDLFDRYTEQTRLASSILGYDLTDLCLRDPHRILSKSQYTQPALYTVNALAYQEQSKSSSAPPDYVLGHSLGEYNAILVAGGFDFETGLRLVQKRGELMGEASGGGMLAVLEIKPEPLQDLLAEHQFHGIELANFNTPNQTVISGSRADIDAVSVLFRQLKIKAIPLNVSAAFHSRFMLNAAKTFQKFASGFQFQPLQLPVISNVTGRPHDDGMLIEMLEKQIHLPVQWVKSIQYLMGQQETQFVEVGGDILGKMVKTIIATCEPIVDDATARPSPNDNQGQESSNSQSTCLAEVLGSADFRANYRIKYAYLAGSMYRGIASTSLVVRMARAGLMGYFGAGGLSLDKIEQAINAIKAELPNGEPFGFNLLHNPSSTDNEMATVSLYLEQGVQFIEAAAFMQVTPALVWFRLNGLKRQSDGSIRCANRILAKVSRPEVAEAFMSPAPQRIVEQLVTEGRVSTEQAELSRRVPLSDEVCVEADSGGHTDRRQAIVILPAIRRLRDEMVSLNSYELPINVGLAGGIGSPEAAAAAFTMGADFVLTGSINQCSVESDTSDVVKDMLQGIGVQDTDYAPAGDMFEYGASVQVLKKGVFFPARARKLLALYQTHNSLEELSEPTRQQLENRYFNRTLQQVWSETRDYLERQGQQSEIEKARRNPKHKMSLVFKWYFGYTTQLALDGNDDHRVSFQVHTGPALGAFNSWVKGTPLAHWRKRHVDVMAEMLMQQTAAQLQALIDSTQSKLN